MPRPGVTADNKLSHPILNIGIICPIYDSKPMVQESSSPASRPVPTQFGKVKPAGARDIVWDRPVFRAPFLPSPQTAFERLPLRTHPFSPRLAGGR